MFDLSYWCKRTAVRAESFSRHPRGFKLDSESLKLLNVTSLNGETEGGDKRRKVGERNKAGGGREKVKSRV